MTQRRVSVGHINVGDTSGSSVTSAHINNDIRSRHQNVHDGQVSHNKKEDLKIVDQKTQLSKKKAKRAPRWRRNAGNNWLIPGTILAIVYTAYFLVARNNLDHWLNMFVKLSYNVPGTDMYGKGVKDYAFVAFHIIFFSFLREFCMQVALKPLAYHLGLRTSHKVNRFLEQMYSLIYYGTTGPIGLYIMRYRCPELWYFNTTAFYEDFPHRVIDMWLKEFYLLQAAFWAQQAIVLLLRLEKPRRDFYELVFHHIITMALIFLSYRFHFTKIGLDVYVTMDLSDFFLALSKILNYLESPAVVFFYFLFVATWIYLRHYLNLVILYSVATEFKTVGPYVLNWETQQYKCWLSQSITFSLLLLLQLVNLYWLWLVLRIAYRYLKDNVKEDVRSEVEDLSDD